MRTSLFLLTSLGLGLSSIACAPPDPPEDPEPLGEAAFALTVDQAVSAGCSTATVKGLGMQIAQEGACIKPGSFVEIPQLDNVVFSDATLPFLEAPARDGLVSALQSAPGTSMQINSALRTVAQQYLLYRWYQLGICGITLAAGPGLSNHETGLALDVQEYNAWKAPLTANGFTWYGANDVVHFDYTGPGAVNYKGTDVLAFQKLWNKNHPGDIIDEDGIYGPQTEGRLKQSPVGGFPIGPDCDPVAATNPDVQLSAAYVDAKDDLPDGESKGRADLYEGDAHQVQFALTNTGEGAATNVDLGVELSDGFLLGIDYLIESDYGHPGTFTENDANSDAANPPHGAGLNPSFTLKMNALAKGETKRLTITFTADLYSIEPDLLPEAHVWVKDIPEAYHQDTWNGAAENPGMQSFNNGQLQVAAPADIYSHTQWLWDTDRREGWQAQNGADLATHAQEGYLSVTPQTDGLAAKIDGLSLNTDSYAGVEIWGRVSGGAQAFLYYATDASPAFDDALRIPLTLPEGEFGMMTVATSLEDGWTGTLTGIGLGVEGGGTLDVDSVRLVSEGGAEGGSGAGGNGSGGSSSYGGGGEGGGYEDFPTRKPMCSCDLPGKTSSGDGVYPLVALVGIGLAMRSRRRGSPGRE